MNLQERVDFFRHHLQQVISKSGSNRSTLFLGHLYVVINSIEHIRKLIERFDDLIRIAVVHPHEIHKTTEGLVDECK